MKFRVKLRDQIQNMKNRDQFQNSKNLGTDLQIYWDQLGIFKNLKWPF
jgi:hypothetical protein